MKEILYRIYCVLTLCLSAGFCANGQTAAMHFQHLGIADGLPQSTVYAMLQDSTGFIWIGTNDGLSRYDGYSFRVFRQTDVQPAAICNNVINCLETDGSGQLLVGTDNGLDSYDPRTEQFTHITLPGATDKTISSLKKDSKGNIWVGTRGSFLRYNPASHNCTRLAIAAIQDQAVSCIMEDQAHILWLACGSTLLKYNTASGALLPLPDKLTANPYFNKSNINVVRQDSAGNTWIATYKDGVILLDKDGQHCTNFRADNAGLPFTNEMIRDVFFYRNHAWIATRHGMYLINAQRKVEQCYLEDKFDASSLTSSSVTCFLKDHAGNVWIGTYSGGINIEYPGNDNFGSINELANRGQGLSNNVISGIAEDKNGNLWIATEGGGLNYYNRRNGQCKPVHINPSEHNINYDFVRSIAFEDEQHLWVGTLGGFFSYDITASRFSPVLLKTGAAKEPRACIPVSLLQTENGLWIGTLHGLFFREKNGSVHEYLHDAQNNHSIINNQVMQLFRDSRNGLWIGTPKGLSYLPAGAQATGSFDNAAPDMALGKDVVLSITEDKSGTIWIGTKENGLFYFDRSHKQFLPLSEKYGVSGKTIHGIVQDKQGSLWISYNNSLAKISLKKSLPPFGEKEAECITYPMQHGPVANEFLNVAFRTNDGEILFGGRNGVIHFYPEKLVVNHFKPPVVITGLLIKNQQVPVESKSLLPESITYTKNITLHYDQAYFTLRFAALNYVNAATNQYAYMLEGLNNDEQWHYVGNEQTATYTSLTPGDYTFKVKAANNDGFWNDQYTSLHITVLPPLWKTWYAYLLYTAVIVGLLYLFYSYSVKTTQLKNELLIQHIRSEQEQELVSRKLNFFTNISHEIKTPLTLILAPLEKLAGSVQNNQAIQQQFLLMRKNGDRLMRLMDQLLDFRKFEEGGMQLQTEQADMVSFTREVVQAFDGLACRNNIRLLFHAQQETIPAWFDKDKFEKILYNLLSNSLKFTRFGGRIIVSLHTEIDDGRENVSLKIEDNGVGIAPARLDKVFEQFHHYNDAGLQVGGTGIGLAFTKALVTLHHGSITVSSRQPDGEAEGYTCFTVTIPAGDKHLTTGDKKAPGTKAYTPITSYGEEEMETPGTVVPVSPEKPVLLVVEDHPEVLAFIVKHYQDAFTVHRAVDGKEGLAAAFRLIPDLIISDVMMPELSGIDMCRQLKTDLRTSHIPVILLTARNAGGHKIEGFANGADEYITKPFSVSLLDTRVQNLLQSRRILRECYTKRILLEPENKLITGPDEQFLEKLTAYIDDNIMEPDLQVESLGQAMNMSRMTLYRKIKALTNQSAVEFIRSFRLKRAAQLLARNEYTVTEVAYMTGFSDADYFRKWFKKEFGQTPREFAAAQTDTAKKDAGKFSAGNI